MPMTHAQDKRQGQIFHNVHNGFMQALDKAWCPHTGKVSNVYNAWCPTQARMVSEVYKTWCPTQAR